MGGTIVCGVDGSRAASAATRAAAELSARLGLRLVLVAVEGAGGDEAGRRRARERARALLDRLVDEQALAGRAERRHEVGDPAERLARVAAEEAADLIVIGGPRPRRFRRAAPALAELAAASPCPVMVVPEALADAAGAAAGRPSHSEG